MRGRHLCNRIILLTPSNCGARALNWDTLFAFLPVHWRANRWSGGNKIPRKIVIVPLSHIAKKWGGLMQKCITIGVPSAYHFDHSALLSKSSEEMQGSPSVFTQFPLRIVELLFVCRGLPGHLSLIASDIMIWPPDQRFTHDNSPPPSSPHTSEFPDKRKPSYT